MITAPVASVTRQSLTFVIPRTLTFEKVVALNLAIRSLLTPLRFATLQAAMEYCNVLFEDEDGRPKIFVDVDVVHTYNKDKKYGSATAKVAVQFPSDDIPGLERLIGLLNHNNRTGHLRSSGADSLVDLIRDLFKVGTAHPSRDHRLKVIDLFWPVVEAYFTMCEDEEGERRITSYYNPFLLSVAEEMAEHGYLPATVIDDIQKAFVMMAKRQEVSAARAAEIVPEEIFQVPLVNTTTESGIGHFIVTDDMGIAEEYFKRHKPNLAILMVRRRCGNVAIFCSGRQNFDLLHARLSELEPDLWFLDRRPHSPELLNASTTRTSEATQLHRPELVKLLQAHYTHRPRQPRT